MCAPAIGRRAANGSNTGRAGAAAGAAARASDGGDDGAIETGGVLESTNAGVGGVRGVDNKLGDRCGGAAAPGKRACATTRSRTAAAAAQATAAAVAASAATARTPSGCCRGCAAATGCALARPLPPPCAATPRCACRPPRCACCSPRCACRPPRCACCSPRCACCSPRRRRARAESSNFGGARGLMYTSGDCTRRRTSTEFMLHHFAKSRPTLGAPSQHQNGQSAKKLNARGARRLQLSSELSEFSANRYIYQGRKWRRPLSVPALTGAQSLPQGKYWHSVSPASASVAATDAFPPAFCSSR